MDNDCDNIDTPDGNRTQEGGIRNHLLRSLHMQSTGCYTKSKET